MKVKKDNQNNKFQLTFVGGMFSSSLAPFVKSSWVVLGNLSTRRFLRGDGYRKLLLLPTHVSRRFGQPWRLGANATSPVLLLLGEREFSFLLFFLLSSSFFFLSAERRL